MSDVMMETADEETTATVVNGVDMAEGWDIDDPADRAEKARETRYKNAAGIDFNAGVPATAIRRRPRKSPWVVKVQALIDGVVAGRGQFNVYYKLGAFRSASGARTTMANLAKKEHMLPDVNILLQSRAIRNDDGTQGSELWGAVCPPDVGDVGEV
jgi:hypothetical protein